MKPAFIFDIDGTIADCSHRLKYIKREKPDWDTFYANHTWDKPIENVVNMLNILYEAGYSIIFVTGRTDAFYASTLEWIWARMDECLGYLNKKRKGTTNVWLYMRKTGDHRPDYEIKKEIYDEHIKDKFNVLGVFEDRDQVVKMWRKLGLTCFQVADGSY